MTNVAAQTNILANVMTTVMFVVNCHDPKIILANVAERRHRLRWCAFSDFNASPPLTTTASRTWSTVTVYIDDDIYHSCCRCPSSSRTVILMIVVVVGPRRSCNKHTCCRCRSARSREGDPIHPPFISISMTINAPLNTIHKYMAVFKKSVPGT